VHLQEDGVVEEDVAVVRSACLHVGHGALVQPARARVVVREGVQVEHVVHELDHVVGVVEVVLLGRALHAHALDDALEVLALHQRAPQRLHHGGSDALLARVAVEHQLAAVGVLLHVLLQQYSSGGECVIV
jgi:hypothetical protein